jgi:hypothetical protein
MGWTKCARTWVRHARGSDEVLTRVRRVHDNMMKSGWDVSLRVTQEVSGVGNALLLCRYSPILRDLYNSVLHSPDMVLCTRTLPVRPGHSHLIRTSSYCHAPTGPTSDTQRSLSHISYGPSHTSSIPCPDVPSLLVHILSHSHITNAI